MNRSKLTDSTVENILFTGVSVKMQITDSISENLTNSDLESTIPISYSHDRYFAELKFCIVFSAILFFPCRSVI